MEYSKDYIMRIIHEMIRTILKLLFKIDGNSLEDSIHGDQEISNKYNKLLSLVGEKKINEAENMLYDMVDITNNNDLLLGLQFYDDLNNYDDEFLEETKFTRHEIKDGINSLLILYGYEGLINIFMLNE